MPQMLDVSCAVVQPSSLCFCADAASPLLFILAQPPPEISMKKDPETQFSLPVGTSDFD